MSPVLNHRKLFLYFLIVLVVADTFLTGVIIKYVPYTEIDWKAYMQEVEGFLSGERNYKNIRGDTGPLVYPAGFLYIYTLLRWVTENGVNVFNGQIVFGVIYILNLIVILSLYYSSAKYVPWWSAILLILSKRVHSIFVLRLFNDCIASFLGYISVLLFSNNQWRIGCLLYSLAVSVKMNILLHAPGLLMLLLMAGGIQETAICLAICASVQVLLGLPFLTSYPLEYIEKSFELGRVFMYKWTVNLKFLPEDWFLRKELSIALLVLTIFGMAGFLNKCVRKYKDAWIDNYHKVIPFKNNMSPEEFFKTIENPRMEPHFIIYTLLTTNFIGVAFARSLHYQFYSWYFHAIPYIAHTAIAGVLEIYFSKPKAPQRAISERMNLFIRLGFVIAVLGLIEFAFNVFPATWWSSAILQLGHIALLTAVYVAPIPDPVAPFTLNRHSKKSN